MPDFIDSTTKRRFLAHPPLRPRLRVRFKHALSDLEQHASEVFNQVTWFRFANIRNFRCSSWKIMFLNYE